MCKSLFMTVIVTIFFFPALVEAKQKYAEWRTAQENKAEQDLQKMSKKPAPYKHLKVRRGIK